jgi:hypothetical protein
VRCFDEAGELQLSLCQVIVDTASIGSGQFVKHVLALYYLGSNGSHKRRGIQLIRFRVQRLGVQLFPALPSPRQDQKGVFLTDPRLMEDATWLPTDLFQHRVQPHLGVRPVAIGGLAGQSQLSCGLLVTQSGKDA